MVQVIRLEIPIRTPTLNAWQRMHWARRKRIGQQIAWILRSAGAPRLEQPLARVRIRVERTSTQAPDIDGLYGGLKPLLDALQPHGKRHPYGIGLIADDSPACIVDLIAVHVPGKAEKTVVIIEVPENKDPAEAGSGSCTG